MHTCCFDLCGGLSRRVRRAVWQKAAQCLQRGLEQRSSDQFRLARGEGITLWTCGVWLQSQRAKCTRGESQKRISADNSEGKRAEPKSRTRLAHSSLHTRKQARMDAINAEYRCPVYSTADLSAERRTELLERPVKTSADILALVSPILSQVREQGDAGLRACVVKFDRCVPAQDDKWPLVLQAPFSDELAKIEPKVKEAIDVAYSNIKVG